MSAQTLAVQLGHPIIPLQCPFLQLSRGLPQTGIHAPAVEQFPVRAGLGDPPRVKHHDAVGGLDGRQLVRDNDRRPALA